MLSGQILFLLVDKFSIITLIIPVIFIGFYYFWKWFIKTKIQNKIGQRFLLILLSIASTLAVYAIVFIITINVIQKQMTNEQLSYSTNEERKLDNFPSFQKYEVQILKPNIYSNYEIDSNITEKKWIGLYRNNNIFELKNSELRKTSIHDEIEDEPEKKTAWNIESSKKGNCEFLIEKNIYLNEDNIINFELPRKELFPGDTLYFKFLDRQYILYALGKKRKISHWNDAYELIDYKLYLSTNKSHSEKGTLIFSRSSLPNFIPKILFSGDLDKDRNLDFIIDTKDDPNDFNPTLYLSKPSKSTDLVVPFASFYNFPYND